VLLSDGRGIPIVLYSMLDQRGHNQVYLAIGTDRVWRSSALTDWTSYYDYRGKGSLRVPFAIAAVQDEGRNRVLISIRHDRFGRSDFSLDLSSLAVRKQRRGSSLSVSEPDGNSASLRSRILPIRDEADQRRAALSWSTLPSNNDRPPVCSKCETRVSDLVLHMLKCDEKRGASP